MCGHQDDIQALMDQVRDKCMEKNIHGIRALAHVFRTMDTDFNKALCFREFRDGFERFGMNFTKDELVKIFKNFDKDLSGEIDFHEFLQELRPPMSPGRVSVILEAFNKLDVSGDGSITLDDLTDEYRENARSHPKYQSGEWDEEAVFKNFLAGFETPGEHDGMVTKEEFLNFYSAISSTTDDDQYFDLMMRNCWKLPPRKNEKAKAQEKAKAADKKQKTKRKK